MAPQECSSPSIALGLPHPLERTPRKYTFDSVQECFPLVRDVERPKRSHHASMGCVRVDPGSCLANTQKDALLMYNCYREIERQTLPRLVCDPAPWARVRERLSSPSGKRITGRLTVLNLMTCQTDDVRTHVSWFQLNDGRRAARAAPSRFNCAPREMVCHRAQAWAAGIVLL